MVEKCYFDYFFEFPQKINQEIVIKARRKYGRWLAEMLVRKWQEWKKNQIRKKY